MSANRKLTFSVFTLFGVVLFGHGCLSTTDETGFGNGYDTDSYGTPSNGSYFTLSGGRGSLAFFPLDRSAGASDDGDTDEDTGDYPAYWHGYYDDEGYFHEDYLNLPTASPIETDTENGFQSEN